MNSFVLTSKFYDIFVSCKDAQRLDAEIKMQATKEAAR